MSHHGRSKSPSHTETYLTRRPADTTDEAPVHQEVSETVHFNGSPDGAIRSTRERIAHLLQVGVVPDNRAPNRVGYKWG